MFSFSYPSFVEIKISKLKNASHMIDSLALAPPAPRSDLVQDRATTDCGK